MVVATATTDVKRFRIFMRRRISCLVLGIPNILPLYRGGKGNYFIFDVLAGHFLKNIHGTHANN